MNRRKLEDVKFHNNQKIITKSQESVDIKAAPTYTDKPILPNFKNSSSKYDFLNKKKSTSSSTQRIFQTPQLPSKKTNIRKAIIFCFIISLIIGAIYLLSTVFLSANVTIVPKNKIFELKHQVFMASQNKNNIPFELMIVSEKENKDIVLTSSIDASEKAKGEITLYNEYSKNPQKIIAGTFISDEKGISYKTNSTISIPGYTLDNTKIIPGQISVEITSFLTGENYNGSPSNFYINSFKNTTKYNKIYGKLKTSLSGGVVGLVYLMDEKGKLDLESADVSKLQDKLMRKLSAQVPEGYILYPNAVKFTFNYGENITSKNPNTNIEIIGTLSAFLLKENNLSQSIINKLLPEIGIKEKSEIKKLDLSSLSFNFTDKNQIINKEIENFDFDITGNLKLDWIPNSNELQNLLVGKNKDNVAYIFKEDPGILSAKVNIMPIWSSTLPTNSNKINIILKNK